MKFEIKNRFDFSVIFTCEADSISLAVKLAIEKKVNLGGANLRGANLGGANLGGANLYDANLGGADLRGANLGGADLGGANLYDANLGGADLYDANLGGANLRGANLGGANLGGANLYGANLYDANLGGADLRGANLGGADLTEVKNMLTFQIVPEIGPFYAFKKLKDNVIATLYVPRSAQRVNSTGRKCRVEKAKVVALSNEAKEAYDKHSGKLLYKLGEWVKPDSFNADIREECTNGIHCFITRKEAEDY